MDEPNEPHEPDAGERDEQIAREFANIKVHELLVNTTTMLASIAAIRLGESPDRDLEQAKLAIDAIKALQRPLADFLDDDMKSQLNGLIASLQMAYVNTVVPASAAEAPSNGEAAPPESGTP
jgi:hypothetical protein